MAHNMSGVPWFIILMICCFTNHVFSAHSHSKKQGAMEYLLNLEPHTEKCADFEDPKIVIVDKHRFKQIDRYKLGVTSKIDLKNNLHNPIQVAIAIDKLEGGNYVFYMSVAYNDFCKDVKDKESLLHFYFSRLGIKSCPIQKRIYEMKNYTVELKELDLGPEHEGRYRSKVTVKGMVGNSSRDVYCKQFYTRVEAQRGN